MTGPSFSIRMKVLCCRKGGAARHANASTPVSCRCAVSRRRRPGSVQAPGPPTPHGPTGSAWSPPHTRHSSRRCRRRSGAERFDLCLSHHFARLDESRALRETSRLFKPDGASARKTPLAPPGLVRYHQAALGTTRHRWTPPEPTRPHQVSPNPLVPARQHQAPSRLTKYHWAPPGLARYPQSAPGLVGYPQSPPGRPHEEQPRAHLPGVSTLRNSAQEINTAAPKPAPACLPQHNFTHRIFLSFFTNHKL